MFKKLLIALCCLFVFSTTYSISNTSHISVVQAKESKDADADAAAAEKKKKALNTTGFTESLDTSFVSKFKAINSMIITIGIILCVIFLVVGGITLGASNGNPQKRSIGISAIICACVGVYVVYKSRMIAGWVIGI